MTDDRVEDWVRSYAPLGGQHVVQVGNSIAGTVAAWVLQTLGAEVTHIGLTEDPESSVPGTDLYTSSKQRVLSLLRQDMAKMAVDESQLYEILDGRWVDIVIFDTEDGWPLPEGSKTVSEYLNQVHQTGIQGWVTIAPFGLSGPSRSQPGGELIALAASGMLHYTRGSGGEIVVPAGFQAETATGHIAALAAVHALADSTEKERPSHMEVSSQEAVLATSVLLETAHVLYGLEGEPGTRRYGPPRGLLACGDGHVYLSILEDHHWTRLRGALGEPAWAQGLEDLADAREASRLVLSRLEEWARVRNRETIVEQLQNEGVPATGVNSCWELLADGDYRTGGYFTRTSVTEETLPGSPVLARTSRNNGSSRGLRGLSQCRIADLSHVLAGPLATSWLGAMGADVVRLEEQHRLDIYRRRGPHPPNMTDPLEGGGYFAAANHSKRSVLQEGEDDTAPLIRLLASADVVVENLSLHRRHHLGLDFDSFRDRFQRSALISSSGFGRLSERAHYRVYGTNLHCHAGIVFHTRDAAGRICNIGTAAWADPLTSIWIALVAATSHMTDTPHRDFDISMAEVVMRHLFDHFAVAAASSPLSEQVAKSIRTEYSPYSIIRTRDNRDVLIVISSEDEYIKLTQSAKAGSEDGALAKTARWETAAEELLDSLDKGFQSLTSEELVAHLRAVGIRAQPVLDAHQLANSSHLQARGFFYEADHPIWRPQRVIGVPWRHAGDGPLEVKPTPLLGEHTRAWWDDRNWSQ